MEGINISKIVNNFLEPSNDESTVPSAKDSSTTSSGGEVNKSSASASGAHEPSTASTGANDIQIGNSGGAASSSDHATSTSASNKGASGTTATGSNEVSTSAPGGDVGGLQSSGTSAVGATADRSSKNSNSNETQTESTDRTEEVVNETRHSHTTEEIERERQIDRHQNIVNVVEQPLKQEENVSGTTTEKTKATTEIEENHAAATDENKAKLNNISQSFERDNGGQLGSQDKTVIDKGESVNENVHTHVQNVVVPVVDKDVHEHNKIKTVIPTHQVINEAPIIQKSSEKLEPMSREEYNSTTGGEKISVKDLQDGSILPQGGSERKINGVEHGTG
jgi:hypothetical protein